MVYNWKIPKEEFVQRMKLVQENIRTMNLDGLVIFSGYLEREGHVCYLTNHHSSFPNIMSHKGLGYSALVLPSEGPGILIAPFGYEDEKVVNIDYAKTGPNLMTEMKSVLEELNFKEKNIGIVGTDVIPAEYYLYLSNIMNKSLINADHILENLRSIKSENELKILEEAAEVSDEGLKAAMETSKPGKKENEIAIEATRAAMEAGADMVVRVRISSGKKIASLRWPMSSKRELQNGDFVYIDFIGFYENYGFDVQRIMVVGGPTPEQKKVLNKALDAENWIIEQLVPGKKIRLVKATSEGFNIDPFMHGIGLEICENPSCKMSGDSFLIEKNMVLCVEPSAGNKDFGDLALEDMVEVTSDGPKILNKYDRILWD
jgi:Xaa-Pro aminopeptidase